jgi:subtilisin family serine protease
VKFRGLFRISVVSVAALGLIGLSACADPKKTPTYICDAGVSAAAEPPPATPPPPDAPLAANEAGEEAKVAVAEAQVLTPDGRVPLVTVEQTPAGPEITSTPVANEAEAEAVAEAAAVDGDLVAVEPDSIVTTDAMDPDDPEFGNDAGKQYALNRVGFVATWDDAYSAADSGAGQTVAVLDTGVDASHQDLDEPGKVQPGVSFVGGAPTDDPHGHGTFVAGIIAAETDNLTAVAGAAPAATILPVKVLDANGKGFTSNVANGIIWAADSGATIINLSLGGPNPSQMVQLAVQHAVFTKGVPVVSSSGNTSKCGAPSFPAAYPEVLAVGATDFSNQWASFSTTGPFVDIAAPGVGIRSILPGDTVGTRTGTSFSAPYAAAAAAIVKATHPTFDVNQVYFRLSATATDLGASGWDPHFGSGLINVRAAAA